MIRGNFEKNKNSSEKGEYCMFTKSIKVNLKKWKPLKTGIRGNVCVGKLLVKSDLRLKPVSMEKTFS